MAAWQRQALIAGAVGVVVCLLGLALPDTRATFFRAWLVGVNLVLGIGVGSLALLMMQWLTGGAWGYALRRPLEAATRTFPALLVLFLPVLLGLPLLYEWADPAAVADNVNLQHKAPYLNVPFVIGRLVIYFAIWGGLAWLLNGWSRRQDESRDRSLFDRCATLSGPGLVLIVLSITFYSIDYLMSLEPEWYSTIYGPMIGIGQVLSAFCFAVSVFILVSDRPPLDQVAVPQTLRDFGSLMLAFVMVWAYMSFMQFLLIWSGNLPEEVPWYLARLQGGWQYAALALVFFHFALPFALLLSVDIKRNRRRLLRVAGMVLVMRMIDLLWLIVPAFHHHHDAEHSGGIGAVLGGLLYPAALIGIGGLWLAYYFYQLQRMPLLPVLNPGEEVTNHGAAAH
ncbi:MAG: hypothetical protein U0736_12145 [Gemmataceae bacterium]